PASKQGADHWWQRLDKPGQKGSTSTWLRRGGWRGWWRWLRLRGRDGLLREGLEQFRAVRAAQPRTGVPASPGRIRAVAARRNVAQRGRPRQLPVQQRIQITHGLAQLLIEQGDKSGPERRYRARPTDDKLLPIRQTRIAGGRIGIARYVRDTAPDVPVRVGRRRDARPVLPGG